MIDATLPAFTELMFARSRAPSKEPTMDCFAVAFLGGLPRGVRSAYWTKGL
jgi:hypothetical protein